MYFSPPMTLTVHANAWITVFISERHETCNSARSRLCAAEWIRFICVVTLELRVETLSADDDVSLPDCFVFFQVVNPDRAEVTNVYSRSLLHLEKRCTNTKLTVRSREDCDCTWRRTEDETTVHQIFCHSRSKTKSETGRLQVLKLFKPYKSSNKHNANILSHLIYPSFHFFSSDEWSSSTSLSFYCCFILYLC